MEKWLREMFRYVMSIISNFSPKLTSKIYYRIKMGKKLDLKNPQTFNEKLMYLKFNEYDNNELVTNCADKYKVREYVEKICGKEILNDLIGVYNSVDEIDFNKLPNKFVLKCNHASGFNIICQDKTKLNIKETKKKLEKWLKTDYWKYVAEVQYKNVEKKIICEKYLESKDQNSIEDYKIYCFNGKPKFCLLCVERNLGKPKYFYFDKEWNLLRINQAGKDAPENFTIPKPESIDKMYEYAEKLAKPFEFVRVDFYDYKSKPIFGELTFTPAGCVDLDYFEDVDKKLGDMLKI